MLRSLLPITGLAFAALAALFIGTGCAAAKEARLGVEETLQPRYVERITSQVGGPVEIHCGMGEACVEVKVVHVQRADPHGHAIMWGSLGITSDAARAARAVIVTAEEIVTPEQLRRDPNRVVIPGLLVAAVCEARWGAHPSPAQGYYRRDHEAYVPCGQRPLRWRPHHSGA